MGWTLGRRRELLLGSGWQDTYLLSFRKQGFGFLGNQWAEASGMLEGQPTFQHLWLLPLPSSFPRGVWGAFCLLSGCPPGPYSLFCSEPAASSRTRLFTPPHSTGSSVGPVGPSVHPLWIWGALGITHNPHWSLVPRPLHSPCWLLSSPQLSCVSPTTTRVPVCPSGPSFIGCLGGCLSATSSSMQAP